MAGYRRGVTRRAAKKPGSIGSQKLRPRKSSVADSAIGSLTPIILSVSTDVASKEPRPPGSTPMVRNSVEIMKLAKTPPSCRKTRSSETSAI
jgi:hypothetical protein